MPVVKNNKNYFFDRRVTDTLNYDVIFKQRKRSSLKSRLKQRGWLLVIKNQKKIYGEGHKSDITV